jgi:hypothetical protein
MPKTTRLLLLLALAGSAVGAAIFPQTKAEQTAPPNALTAEEKAQGWRLLFDGRTLAGWRGLGLDRVPEKHWVVEDGAIKKVPTKDVPLQADGQPAAGGDLMTVETFRDFEFAFEWKVGPGGNSGVKYNVSEEMSLRLAPNRAALGFEYQILDDGRHPDALVGAHRTAAGLYDLIPPAGKSLRPVGEWNDGRVVFRGNHGEHWLNGRKVLEYDLGTAEMSDRLAKSKYRTIPGFADRRRGAIVLQDHTDPAWFRSLKIRVF